MAELDDNRSRWLRIADLVIGAAMLGLAFVGIAASDVSGLGSQTYWTVIAVLFGLASLALHWMHQGEGGTMTVLLRLALHWLGVLVAIQLVYLFISAGRLTNADDGLVNGAILALGTWLGGVQGDWRLLVIGTALAAAMAVAALLEQFLWVFIAVALITVAALYLIGRFRAGRAG